MQSDEKITLNGIEYVPVSKPIETQQATSASEPFWGFLRSPQFWMIGIAAIASILIRDDFQALPWNQLVGQTLTIWGSGAAGFGLLNKVSKNVSSK